MGNVFLINTFNPLYKLTMFLNIFNYKFLIFLSLISLIIFNLNNVFLYIFDVFILNQNIFIFRVFPLMYLVFSKIFKFNFYIFLNLFNKNLIFMTSLHYTFILNFSKIFMLTFKKKKKKKKKKS